MGYLVLARKWRPQVFDDLIGQPHIVKILRNTLTQKKVHHAYVFSGPRGVGKTTTARILAKSLNCVEGPTPSPCGRCEFCISIANGSSMDVIEIDGASNNSVDDIREIRERVRYAPSVSGKYKIYIIDEAHMLSESAFNALLKTIEEPPPHTIFVLATTAYRKIPVTVLSRCQHLTFRRIPRDIIVERLKHICQVEGVNISDDAVDIIAKYSDGSMRDALTLLEQVCSFSDNITAKDVTDLLGISDLKMVSDLAEAIFDSDQKRIFYLIHEAVEKGSDLRILYKDLMVFLRDMLILKTLEDSSSSGKVMTEFEISRDELDNMLRLSKKVSEEELVLMINDLIRSESDIKNATFPRIALEMSLIRISYFKEFASLKDVIEGLKKTGFNQETTEGGSQGNSNEFPRGAVKAVVNNDEVVREERLNSSANQSGSVADVNVSEDIIKELLNLIDQKDHVLSSKLMHASMEFREDTLYIKFNGGHAFLAKTILEEQDIIKGTLEGLINRPVKIKIITSAEQVNHDKNYETFKREILSRPEVKEIIELFNGSVIEIKRTRK